MAGLLGTRQLSIRREKKRVGISPLYARQYDENTYVKIVSS